MILRIKSIVWLALLGAVGFGIGGLIIGTLIRFLGESVPLATVGVVVAGAFGGASIWIGLRRKAWQLALAGAIGFLSGGFLGGPATFFVNFEAGLLEMLRSVTPVTIGALTGAALSLTISGSFRITICLAAVGILGGIVGLVATSPSVIPFIIRTNPPSLAWLLFGLQGAIGGTFLGAALGFFKKQIDVQDG